MGDRLTSQWTATLDEAYGEMGTKGRLGEEFVADVLTKWGYDVNLHTDDKGMQVSGIDITFRKPGWFKSYTADVKTNLNESSVFTVETTPTGWLFGQNKKSDRIWHCNVEKRTMAWYGRGDMKQFVLQLSLSEECKYITISPYSVYVYGSRVAETPNFIKFRKIDPQSSGSINNYKPHD